LWACGGVEVEGNQRWGRREEDSVSNNIMRGYFPLTEIAESRRRRVTSIKCPLGSASFRMLWRGAVAIIAGG